jgi:cytochrome P450
MSRASTRALLGADLCRNEHWVEYIVSYIGNSYRAARDLRQWPQLLQPVVHWFIASCQDLRKDFARCHAIVNPVVEQRKRDKELRISKGLKPQDHCDSIDWIDEVANGRNYNATAAQIVLSIAGIFSSTDTLTQIIYDICDKPDLINDLRKEIVSTLTGNGWSKKCMYQLKLMDSVMKETQRLKPIAVGEFA